MIRRNLLPPALLIGILIGILVCAAVPAEQRILYEKQSSYNHIVVTEDDQGLRTLRFERGGARQSVVKPDDVDHVELPYARAMPIGIAVVERPRRALIVGLGGGTIPRFLHKHYPRTTIEVVDIDPEVVHVAKKFFGFREGPTMRVFVRDGRRFIEDRRDRYDLIFLDAFGSDDIPTHLTTREFLLATRRALTARGAVIANVWSRGSNPLYDSMVRTYRDVFDELYVLDVPFAGNKILIALPYERQFRQEALAQRASTISGEKRFPFDLGEMVMHGFHHAAEENPRGRILTDSAQP